MKLRPFYIRLICVCLMAWSCIAIWGQHNVYIAKDTIPQIISIIPQANKILCFGDKVIIENDNKVAELLVNNVKSMSLRETTNQTNLNIPPSLRQDFDFDIRFDKDDIRLVNNRETEVTDSTLRAYSDFEDHTIWKHTIRIEFGKNEAIVRNTIDSVEISVNGNHVIVNSKQKDVEYRLSGESANGSIKFYSIHRFKVGLNSLKLTNPKGAVINNQSKKRMYVVLDDNTDNFITDGKDYAKVQGEDQKGCLFSEGQICISGGGKLVVEGNKKNAIASDEYIHIISGMVCAHTSKSKGAGIKVQNSFEMGGGVLQILAEGRGAKGISSDSVISITGGKITAICSGDAYWNGEENDFSSACGIKADIAISITNAEIHLLATGTGGKCISVGNTIYKTQDVETASGTEQRIVLAKEKYSNALYPVIKKQIGTLTINNSLIYCKTSGERALQDVDFCNEMSSLYYYPQQETNSPAQYYILASTSPKVIKALESLNIANSEIFLRGTGGDGAEGIESKNNIKINNSKIRTACYDDGINALLTSIDGGSDIFALSYRNDGIDSKIDKCDGTVYLVGGTGADVGIDTDGGRFYVPDGARVIAMSENKNHKITQGQNSAQFKIYNSSNFLALVDSVTNKPLVTFNGLKNYNTYWVMLSLPELIKDKTYQLVAIDVVEGGNECQGVVAGGNYKGQKIKYSFNMSNAYIELDKNSTGGGGSLHEEDNIPITIDDEKHKIVSAAIGRGGLTISDGYLSYTHEDDNENIWWYIDKRGKSLRFRNAQTNQCIAIPKKEYSCPTLLATEDTAQPYWWSVTNKSDCWEIYHQLSDSTKWYLKTSKDDKITVDRYNSNTSFFIVDANGQQ